MIWYCFLSISIITLEIAIILAIYLHLHPQYTGKAITPFNVLFIGLFISIFYSLLPMMSTSWNSISAWGFAFILALHNTFQVFTINSDLKAILNEANPPTLYSLFIMLEFIIAPLFTFGFLASLLKDYSSGLKLLLSFKGDIYAFSDLNEKSLALGSDIRKKHKDAVIVYAGLSNSANAGFDSLVTQAKKLRSICFARDIRTIRSFGILQNHLILFSIANDEAESIECSLDLIRTHKNRENTRLYVFTQGITGDLVLSAIDTGKIKVRRVNEIQSLINRFLYERGNTLFDHAISTQAKEKQINAVILGLGYHGKEMLKALAWYGQMDGYNITINAYDIDEFAKDRLLLEMPELLSQEYNGITVQGEAQYNITIHSGINVETESFANLLRKNQPTFVFISLGSDEKNIKAAVNVRILSVRMKFQPSIHAIITNTNTCDSLKDACNFKKQPYDIDFWGDVESSYSEDVILNSALENDCLNSYKASNISAEDAQKKEIAFWKYDYNYRSKTASILHIKARKHCGIPGTDKDVSELTEEEKSIIESLEHRRWNAYMRAEGYIYSGSRDKSSRNDLGKMHNDLVNTNKLSADDNGKDLRI